MTAPGPNPIPLDTARPPPLAQLAPHLSLRLDGEEIRAIKEAIREEDAPIYLFGSRVEPQRRGGDIDLLVLTGAPAFETSPRIATRFFAHCEEKIDVVVMNPACLTPAQQAFLDSIQAIRIH